MSCGVGEANHGQVQVMFLGDKLPGHGAIIIKVGGCRLKFNHYSDPIFITVSINL